MGGLKKKSVHHRGGGSEGSSWTQFVSLSVHGHPSSVSPREHQRRKITSKIKLLGNGYHSNLTLWSILSLNRENNLKGYFFLAAVKWEQGSKNGQERSSKQKEITKMFIRLKREAKGSKVKSRKSQIIFSDPYACKCIFRSTFCFRTSKGVLQSLTFRWCTDHSALKIVMGNLLLVRQPQHNQLERARVATKNKTNTGVLKGIAPQFKRLCTMGLFTQDILNTKLQFWK